MVEIKDLLKKFDKIISSQNTKFFFIQKIILTHSKIKLTKNEIIFLNKKILIKTNPIKKNEIFLKKEKILEDLKKEKNNFNFYDLV